MAGGGRVELAEDRLLDRHLLRHRLDHDIRQARAVAGDVRDQPVERSAHQVRFPEPAAVQLRGAADRGRDILRRTVLQRDPQALHRAPGGDVAAHGAGADDMHMAEPCGGLPAQRLQPLVQEEDTHEILRRRSGYEAGNRARLVLQHLRLRSAVSEPEID